MTTPVVKRESEGQRASKNRRNARKSAARGKFVKKGQPNHGKFPPEWRAR